MRIVILLGALSIAGITFTQIYWVRKAFDIRENQFYRDVNASLRNVAAKIFEISKTPSPANNPVNQVSTNYFIVAVNGPINPGVLEFLLLTEFEKRNITADFEYGVYDCVDRCMIIGNAITQKNRKLVHSTPLPALHEGGFDGYYFGVQFPRVEANLISQMGIWGFSSAVNLVVIFFFVYTLFVILKQRRLSEIQKDFINNMTHEFRTPISTIAISAEVLKDPTIIKSPERLLNYTTIIQNENNRLRQQVERVLQMARIDRGEIVLKKDEADIHEIVREAIEHFSLSIQKSRGRVEFNLKAGRHIVLADKLHLTNVFHNLIDNAIKYCRVAPVIQVSSENRDGTIHLTLQDSGIGIHPDHHRKVFHKFYRVSTGNVHDVKGFGIGLHYVKLVVEAHKGKITLNSVPGKGSTFELTFPLT